MSITRRHRPRLRLMAVRLPEDLILEIQILLADPFTGKIRYGAWSHTCERIMRDWVASQRSIITNQQHAKEFATNADQ